MSVLRRPVPSARGEDAAGLSRSDTRGLRPWKEAAKVLLWSRAVFFGVAYAANWVIALFAGGPRPQGLTMWVQWDAIDFLLVARHGYTSPLTFPHATAFFPALPLLLRSLMAAGLGGSVAGLVLSALACLVAFAYLWRLAEEEMGPGAGRTALWFLAFFPTAVFLVPGYTEPLFLAGAIPAFYYGRRRRWRYVALPAACAVAARFVGVFLLVALAVEAARSGLHARRLAAACVALLVGFLPLAAYGLFLNQARGDFAYYFTDQRLGWQHVFTTPWQTLANTTLHPGAPLELTAMAIGLAFVVWAVLRREWGYAAFMAGPLVSLLLSGYLLSTPRTLLVSFPFVLFLTDKLRHNAPLTRISLALSGTGALAGAVAFTHGWGFY